MRYSSVDPRDLPQPRTVDTIARAFTVPLMSLVAQPHLTEMGAATESSSRNGGPEVIEVVSLSFTFWRNPSERDDPQNRAHLTVAERDALETPPARPLPEWMMERRRLMLFPTLWEAVATTRIHGSSDQSPESTLVHHVNHVLVNTFREHRVVGGFPGELDAPVNRRHIEQVPVTVDGRSVPGVRIDTDPDVFGIGAALGDRVVTAAVSREYLPQLTLEFVTR